jgi:hypothetical protein
LALLGFVHHRPAGGAFFVRRTRALRRNPSGSANHTKASQAAKTMIVPINIIISLSTIVSVDEHRARHDGNAGGACGEL